MNPPNSGELRDRLFRFGLERPTRDVLEQFLGRSVSPAALLLDIGHLAVPEHILSKPGPLSYEEFERVTLAAAAGEVEGVEKAAALLADVEGGDIPQTEPHLDQAGDAELTARRVDRSW